MGKDVIIACDFAGAAETFRFLARFTGRKPFVKIGMELFYAEGPEIVRELKRRGHRIFLDLKLHDIPNTVKKTMAVLSSLDVDIVNLHAGGTAPMMKAALEGLFARFLSESAALAGGSLLLMLAGALSSIVPVPGGFGAFHFIVAAAVSYVYGLPFEFGIIFATLSHESQELNQLVWGGISFVIEQFRKD